MGQFQEVKYAHCGFSISPGVLKECGPDRTSPQKNISLADTFSEQFREEVHDLHNIHEAGNNKAFAL